MLSESGICKIFVTFIEIYREETTDLLDNSASQLQIREDETGNTGKWSTSFMLTSNEINENSDFHFYCTANI